MKIQRNISRKAKIFYGLTLIVVIAGMGFGAYAYLSRDTSTSTDTNTADQQHIDTNLPTEEQIQAGQEAKQKTVEEETSQKTPVASDGGNQEQLSVTITAASQNGTTVSIRALISNSVSQAGSCKLVITNGTRLVTKTAATQALANSSTCQGFDVQVSELGTGTWKIQLDTTIGTQSGSASKAADIY